MKLKKRNGILELFFLNNMKQFLMLIIKLLDFMEIINSTLLNILMKNIKLIVGIIVFPFFLLFSVVIIPMVYTVSHKLK